MNSAATSSKPSKSFTLQFIALRTVTAPEDQDAGRKRYCGVAKADALSDLSCEENVRAYLGMDEDGKKRKSTLVNMAIRQTIENDSDHFTMLNTGLVIVARNIDVDSEKKQARLGSPSIINGAQTKGLLDDYIRDHPDAPTVPSVNFELIITDDEELIGEISIARNFQNRVADLSIYGRSGTFDKLEAAMQKHDSSIKLRKKETDFGDGYLDTEKLVQVITVMAPQSVPLPSVDRSRRTPETTFRVYAYRHRSRCLKDFALVMEQPDKWPDAHSFFLHIAVHAWELYQRLKGEQYFSSLHCVKGTVFGATKTVAPDGVPDGVVFPMLSALSRFVREHKGVWLYKVPKNFPWNTLFGQARTQETSVAHNDPQAMGKDADCYIALHGAIDMFFAATEQSDWSK
jgi:hypothetical protein